MKTTSDDQGYALKKGVDSKEIVVAILRVSRGKVKVKKKKGDYIIT